jgi:hypothetical protein
MPLIFDVTVFSLLSLHIQISIDIPTSSTIYHYLLRLHNALLFLKILEETADLPGLSL